MIIAIFHSDYITDSRVELHKLVKDSEEASMTKAQGDSPYLYLTTTEEKP